MNIESDKDLPAFRHALDHIGARQENSVPQVEDKDYPDFQLRHDGEHEDFLDQPDCSYHSMQRDGLSPAFGNRIAPTNVGFFEMPLRNFLNGKKYHMHLVSGLMRHKALLRAFGDRIVRAVTSEAYAVKGETIDSLIIRLDETSVLWVGDNWLRLYTGTREQSKAWRRQLRRFWKRAGPATPKFSLIAIGGMHGISEEAVEVNLRARMSRRKLALHYGEEFLERFYSPAVRFLKEKDHSGVLVLRGEPGGGKTSLIRHLMVELHRTHVFYVIPPDQFTSVTAHHLIEFQRNCSRQHPDKILVLVIEDSEALVLPRAVDNYCQVSNLLNLVSGFLADYIQPKIIMTLNTELERIDPALLRPGRLRGQWEFARLDYGRAVLLAASLSKVLPEDRAYTLAEIYNTPAVGNGRPARKRMGFQPQLSQ